MYNILKNVQITIALLKKYNIKHLVLSPGSRNVPFVHSVEEDSFFTCYSIVDERGAGFFAIGLAKELNEPVLISCTSSTASSNYFHAVKQACKENIPLIVLTADRNPYNRGQMENQMIEQINMYHSFCKKSVDLPTVIDSSSFKYCERLVNEALLELDHHGKGPVHINFPAFKGFTDFSVSELPECRKIDRIAITSNNDAWVNVVNELQRSSRILFIIGEGIGYKSSSINLLEEVANRFNIAVSVEHMSNVFSKIALHTYPVTESITNDELQELMPEIVVTFQGNFTSSIKEKLRSNSCHFKHWRVNSDGNIIDTFGSLTKVFECSDDEFFINLLRFSNAQVQNHDYEKQWINKSTKLRWPDVKFTNFYCIKEICSKIPEHSIVHLSVLNSIRMANFFSLNSDVICYANIGAYGIDGCLSTFIGQAYDTTRLAFLIIGDLSFLYDLNALTIQEIPNNIRIIVINNHGGGEFYNNYMGHGISDIGKHIAANHKSCVKSLAIGNGIDYLSAKNFNELAVALDDLVINDKDRPVILEISTDIVEDANTLRQFYRLNSHLKTRSRIKGVIKKIL